MNRVYSLDSLDELISNIRKELEYYKKTKIKKYIVASMSLTAQLNGNGFQFLYSLCDFVSADEFSDMALEAGYENVYVSDVKTEPNKCSDIPNFTNGNPKQNGWKPTEYYLGLFGLPIDASWEDVIKAHREMIMFFHPDNFMDNEKRRSQAEEKSKQINIAFDELKARRK